MKKTEHIEVYRCVGPSQWPTIRNRDSIGVKEVAAADILAGDLIVYLKDGIQICHRVLDRRQVGGVYFFLCKGDGNLRLDGWISERVVRGKVEGIMAEGDLRPRSWVQRVLSLSTLFQYRLFRLLLASRVGITLGKFRSRWTSQPIFTRFFFYLSSPWLWFPSAVKRSNRAR